MDSDSLYRLLGAGKQPLQGDHEAKRLFHPSQTVVENLSLCMEQRK
jgi:hypothetical protein